MRKSEQTKEKILYTLGSMMKQRDISDINIRTICKEAGISIGTFYLYFPCKEAALLYCYHKADEVFEQMDLKDTPMANLRTIMDTYFHMVALDDLCAIQQLYTCHIKYHDRYFFDEERPIFHCIVKEIYSLIKDDVQSKKMAMQILTMARGMIFHICCMEEKQIDAQWHIHSTNELMDYIGFLCQRREK